MAEAHLFVDQIEGDVAVLVEEAEDADEHPLPLSDLPIGTKEGDWLTVDIPDRYTVSSFLAAVQNGDEKMPYFALDDAAKEATNKQVQSLMDELSS